MSNELMSTQQIADLLQVTPRYIQRLCEEGFFGEYAFKVGKRWRVAAWYVRQTFHLEPEAVR